jgi:hypothetical protein
MAANKTDTNDADGPAHLVEVGFFREVRVMSTFIDADSRGSQKPTNVLWLPPVMQEASDRVRSSVRPLNAALSEAADQSHQGSRPLAEVDRLARHINDDARRDHGLRTAQRILAR